MKKRGTGTSLNIHRFTVAIEASVFVLEVLRAVSPFTVTTIRLVWWRWTIAEQLETFASCQCHQSQQFYRNAKSKEVEVLESWMYVTCCISSCLFHFVPSQAKLTRRAPSTVRWLEEEIPRLGWHESQILSLISHLGPSRGHISLAFAKSQALCWACTKAH